MALNVVWQMAAGERFDYDQEADRYMRMCDKPLLATNNSVGLRTAATNSFINTYLENDWKFSIYHPMKIENVHILYLILILILAHGLQTNTFGLVNWLVIMHSHISLKKGHENIVKPYARH